MAKKVKFPLKMADDARVSSLEELREHFNLESVLGYYTNGRLMEWLEDRYYDDEAERIGALDSSAPGFQKELCGALGVEYAANEAEDLNLADIAAKNERRERLKKITADETILAAADRVAFTQEDLADLLDNDVKEIYLCTGPFKIPGRMEHVTYIGVDHPKVDPPKDFVSKGIVFKNVDVGIDDLIRQASEAPRATDATLWLMAAEMGNAKAQYMVGCRYRDGDSNVEQSYEEAVKWFRKAAEQNYAEAQDDLGDCYDGGEGVEQNYEEAVKWYRKAAEQGLPRAQNDLGLCYWSGDGVEQNYAEANKWFRKAAEQGYAAAQYNLADSYDYGKGIEEDEEEATKWYRKAAEQGHAEAQYNFGYYYYDHGYREKAVEWFLKAAEQGVAAAQRILGRCYYWGEGVEKNYQEAAKWFRKAAEQGDAEGQRFLGVFYLRGLGGIEQNNQEAVKWLRKASDQGDVNAPGSLAIYYKDVEHDSDEAIKWHHTAIERGHYELESELDTYCFALGQQAFYREDYTAAVKFYRESAELGNVEAQKMMGKLLSWDYFEDGYGRDLGEAAKWYLRAAEQGDAFAMNWLGHCYLQGACGLAKNVSEGLNWLRSGAERGWGIYSLAELLRKGDYGIEPDLDEAIMWYRKAVHEGTGHQPSLARDALKKLGVSI